MRYLIRFGRIFVVFLAIVIVLSLVVAWDEAGDIGFLAGNMKDKVTGLFEYWLFWVVLYTGPFYLMVTLALALLLTLVTIIYEFSVAQLRGKGS